jgi:3-oxosteroid 1-dehydrogenase
MGPGLAAAFIRAALTNRRIRALTRTPVRELIVDGDGGVAGVRAEREGRDYFVRARAGVVLAVGGYDHRPDIARSFEDVTEWHSASPTGLDGDNLVMGGEIGAATAALPARSLAVLLGYHIPGERFEGNDVWRFTFETGLPGVILVNSAGERFADESFYREWLPKLHHWDGRLQKQANFPVFMIFDEAYRRTYPFGPLPPGSELPQELIASADTPAALGAKLGIDDKALDNTISRFNTMTERGVDDDFARGSYPWANFMCGDLRHQPNPNLGPLATPPYYGLPLSMVSAGINAAGLRFDRHGRVLHVRGHHIPGLYAVGNSTAHLDTGAGYQSGFANCRGMTWGYIAGRHIAARTSTGEQAAQAAPV